MKKLKKIFTRILALALVAIFFTAPTSALAATSRPVLIEESGLTKRFMYQPTPYVVKKGLSEQLRDTTRSDGRWYIPAQHDSLFEVHFQDYCDFKIVILKAGVPGIYYTAEFYDTADWSEPFQPSLDDGYYTFTVIPLSNNVAIQEYTVFCYPE